MLIKRRFFVVVALLLPLILLNSCLLGEDAKDGGKLTHKTFDFLLPIENSNKPISYGVAAEATELEIKTLYMFMFDGNSEKLQLKKKLTAPTLSGGTNKFSHTEEFNSDITGSDVKRFVFIANITDNKFNGISIGTSYADFCNMEAEGVLTDKGSDKAIFKEIDSKKDPIPMVGVAYDKTTKIDKVSINSLHRGIEVKFTRAVARIDIEVKIPNFKLTEAKLMNTAPRGYLFGGKSNVAPSGTSFVSEVTAFEDKLVKGGDGIDGTASEAEQKKCKRVFYLYERQETDKSTALSLFLLGELKVGSKTAKVNFRADFLNETKDKGRVITRNNLYKVCIGDGSELEANAQPAFGIFEVDPWNAILIQEKAGEKLLVLTEQGSAPKIENDKITLEKKAYKNGDVLKYKIEDMFANTSNVTYKAKGADNQDIPTNSWCKAKFEGNGSSNSPRYLVIELEPNNGTKVRSKIIAIHIGNETSPIYRFLVEQKNN